MNKVQLKLYMQPLSSPLPTTLEQYLPVSFPPTPLQILAQTPVGMGLTDRVHTRSGQFKRSLRSSGEPQAPVGQCSPPGMSTVSLVALTEEYIKHHGIEIFRQSVAYPFGRNAADATRAHFAGYARATPGRRAIESGSASMMR